jgi:hypothetical protein
MLKAIKYIFAPFIYCVPFGSESTYQLRENKGFVSRTFEKNNDKFEREKLDKLSSELYGVDVSKMHTLV